MSWRAACGGPEQWALDEADVKSFRSCSHAVCTWSCSLPSWPWSSSSGWSSSATWRPGTCRCEMMSGATADARDDLEALSFMGKIRSDVLVTWFLASTGGTCLFDRVAW